MHKSQVSGVNIRAPELATKWKQTPKTLTRGEILSGARTSRQSASLTRRSMPGRLRLRTHDNDLTFGLESEVF